MPKQKINNELNDGTRFYTNDELRELGSDTEAYIKIFEKPELLEQYPEIFAEVEIADGTIYVGYGANGRMIVASDDEDRAIEKLIEEGLNPRRLN